MTGGLTIACGLSLQAKHRAHLRPLVGINAHRLEDGDTSSFMPSPLLVMGFKGWETGLAVCHDGLNVVMKLGLIGLESHQIIITESLMPTTICSTLSVKLGPKFQTRF